MTSRTRRKTTSSKCSKSSASMTTSARPAVSRQRVSRSARATDWPVGLFGEHTNTIFVLATTEANKVLPTVVDRCHRFDFSRPSVPQISAVLKRVAERESITIPDEATALIARSATGSFRDALGTLEQLLAYSGKEIALDDVLAVLGAADADLVFGAVDAVAAGQQRDALLAASSKDTVRSRSFTGKPCRMLRNDWTDAWEAPDAPKPLGMPLQFMVTSEAVSRGHRYADKARDVMFNPVGQIVGTMNAVQPVKDVLYQLVQEYLESVDRLQALSAE